MKTLVVVFSILLTTRLMAVQSFSMGAKFDGAPGVSALVSLNPEMAYHISASVRPGEFAILDIERTHYLLSASSQKLLSTSFFLRPYFSYGLRSEVSRSQEEQESISAKGTLGAEFMSYQSPIQIFIDASPLIGPLPNLSTKAVGRIGLRTHF